MPKSPLVQLWEQVADETTRLVIAGVAPMPVHHEGLFARALARAQAPPPACDLAGKVPLELLAIAQRRDAGELEQGCSSWLDRVWSMRFGDGAASVAEASRALEAITLLGDHLSRPGARRLRRRALALLGNAQRIAGDFASAAALLEEAEDACHGLDEFAHTRGLRVSLLVDRGDFEEAATLAVVVIVGWRMAGRPDQVAWARLQRARILGELGDVAGAVRGFLRILRETGRVPGVVTLAAHNAAELFSRIGDFEEAAAVLDLAVPLYRTSGQNLDRQRRWVEGRVALGRGEVERAERVLRDVAEEYRSEERPVDAALISLDLALVYASRSRWVEIVRLMRTCAEQLDHHGVERDAVAAVWAARAAAREHAAEVSRSTAVALAITAARARLQVLR